MIMINVSLTGLKVWEMWKTDWCSFDLTQEVEENVK